MRKATTLVIITTLHIIKVLTLLSAAVHTVLGALLGRGFEAFYLRVSLLNLRLELFGEVSPQVL